MKSKGLFPAKTSVHSIVQADLENANDSDDDEVSSTCSAIWQPPHPKKTFRPTTIQAGNDIKLAKRFDAIDDHPPAAPCCPLWAPRRRIKHMKPTAPKRRKNLIASFVKDHANEIATLERYSMSNHDVLTVPPPAGSKDAIIWGMIDSGSNPMVADCPKYFPDHPIRPSKAQRNGVKYYSASGCAIKNEGEISVVHRGPCGKDFGLVIQNAKVACPIMSVRYFTRMNCEVVFKKC